VAPKTTTSNGRSSVTRRTLFALGRPAAFSPTSRSTPPATFHPEITVGEETTRVLCEMVGAVDVRALGEQVAHLALEEARAVDEALLLVLGRA